MNVLYALHVSCAALSIGGFALRGFWMLSAGYIVSVALSKSPWGMLSPLLA